MKRGSKNQQNGPPKYQFLSEKQAFFVCTSASEPVPLPRLKKRAYFEKLSRLSKLPNDFNQAIIFYYWEKTGKSLQTKEYGAETEKRYE
jgi:hypothetical protein